MRTLNIYYSRSNGVNDGLAEELIQKFCDRLPFPAKVTSHTPGTTYSNHNVILADLVIIVPRTGLMRGSTNKHDIAKGAYSEVKVAFECGTPVLTMFHDSYRGGGQYALQSILQRENDVVVKDEDNWKEGHATIHHYDSISSPRGQKDRAAFHVDEDPSVIMKELEKVLPHDYSWYLEHDNVKQAMVSFTDHLNGECEEEPILDAHDYEENEEPGSINTGTNNKRLLLLRM